MFLLMLSLPKAIFFLTAHIQLSLNLRTHLSMVRKCFIVNSACVAACILDSFLLLHVMQLFDRSMSSHPPGSWFGLFGLLHFGSFFLHIIKVCHTTVDFYICRYEWHIRDTWGHIQLSFVNNNNQYEVICFQINQNNYVFIISSVLILAFLHTIVSM